MLKFRIALAQINTTVGDLEGNARQIIDYMERTRSCGRSQARRDWQPWSKE